MRFTYMSSDGLVRRIWICESEPNGRTELAHMAMCDAKEAEPIGRTQRMQGRAGTGVMCGTARTRKHRKVGSCD